MIRYFEFTTTQEFVIARSGATRNPQFSSAEKNWRSLALLGITV
jgi:hypothetical protein